MSGHEALANGRHPVAQTPVLDAEPRRGFRIGQIAAEMAKPVIRPFHLATGKDVQIRKHPPPRPLHHEHFNAFVPFTQNEHGSRLANDLPCRHAFPRWQRDRS